MSDPYDQLVDTILAIKSDKALRESFLRVLKIGGSTQQVRVSTLQRELESRQAPTLVIEFVKLLADDKIASLVLKELEN